MVWGTMLPFFRIVVLDADEDSKSSSTKEFHDPQAWHFPTQAEDCCPQLEQNQAVFAFAIMLLRD
jgi:hypothetical protein